MKEVSVALSKVDHVSVHPAADVELLLPKGTDPASLERTLDLESPVDAPVTEGQVLGTLSLSLEGEVLTTVDLLASHDVEASGLLLFWRNVRNFFSSTAVKVVGIALLVLAAALAGLFGILAALGLVIWYLCTIDSDGVAYMAPFVDSERPTIFRTLLRRPQPDEKFRPPEYDSPNRRRQR